MLRWLSLLVGTDSRRVEQEKPLTHFQKAAYADPTVYLVSD